MLPTTCCAYQRSRLLLDPSWTRLCRGNTDNRLRCQPCPSHKAHGHCSHALSEQTDSGGSYGRLMAHLICINNGGLDDIWAVSAQLNRAFSLGPSAETPSTAHPAHTGRSVFQVGKYSDVTVLVSFCPAWQQGSTCTVLLSKDQAIPAPCLPSRPPNGKGGFQDEGPVPFSQLPPRGPDFILFFFFPCATQLHGDLSCSFGCEGSSVSFQLVFCENCSTCTCIFDVFVEMNSSFPPAVLTSLP